MSNIAIQFTFKYCEYTSLGYSQYNAFKMAANDFKRYFIGEIIHKRKDLVIHRFFFSDNSTCTYNVMQGYFNFQSQF
jgi:hypothetical protein